MPTRHKKVQLKETLAAVTTCRNRGFVIPDLHADTEFECSRAELMPAILNTVAPDDHVGEIEWSIQTIKEDVRTMIHRLPYNCYSCVMVHGAISKVVQDLNQFPA